MNPFRVPPRSEKQEERPRAHTFRLHVDAQFAHLVIATVCAALLTVLAR